MEWISNTRRQDYEKMGIHAFFVIKKNQQWVFERNGDYYPFAPAILTSATLSPIIVGTDRLINIGCKIKKVKDYENGFLLLVGDDYFPACDVKMSYKEPLYDGWVYDVEEVNLKGLMADQGAWLCPYIKFYYPEPPKILYLKMESITEDGTPI